MLGSRTIAPDENCLPLLPPTPKLTLSQTLALAGGQFSSVAIVRLPPPPTNRKTNPHLDPNHNPNQGAILLWDTERLNLLTIFESRSFNVSFLCLLFYRCFQRNSSDFLWALYTNDFTVLQISLSSVIFFSSNSAVINCPRFSER